MQTWKQRFRELEKKMAEQKDRMSREILGLEKGTSCLYEILRSMGNLEINIQRPPVCQLGRHGEHVVYLPGRETHLTVTFRPDLSRTRDLFEKQGSHPVLTETRSY